VLQGYTNSRLTVLQGSKFAPTVLRAQQGAAMCPNVLHMAPDATAGSIWHDTTKTRILGSRCYKDTNSGLTVLQGSKFAPTVLQSDAHTSDSVSHDTKTSLAPNLWKKGHSYMYHRKISSCFHNEETTWARCRALVAQRRFTQVRPLRRPVRPPLRRRGGGSIRTCGACLRRLVHMRSSQLTSRPPPVHRFVCAF
jgi:hypothetical protein